MALCKGTTASGEPCKNQALEDSDYCGIHARQAEPQGPEIDDTPEGTPTEEPQAALAEAPKVAPTGANSPGGTFGAEAPERIDRAEGAPEGTLALNDGFPFGPTLLAPVGRFDDNSQAAQHIGWVRPVAMPEPMPDVSGWKSWEWAATGSARDNFDRVLVRPGTVIDTERDFYDAQTCEREYTLGAGATASMWLVPTNYIDRRRRALTLRVYDVTVPESLAFKTA